MSTGSDKHRNISTSLWFGGKKICLQLLSLGPILTSQCPFKQITQAMQCFSEWEQRLPLTVILLVKRFSRFLRFRFLKIHSLLSEQFFFFLNSSYVTKLIGNVSISQMNEENKWVDSAECLIIIQNYCGTHLWTHTHVHPPANVKGRFILALNREMGVTVFRPHLSWSLQKENQCMTTCRSHGWDGNIG